MVIPDTNGENFIFHPCYEYPLEYNGRQYDSIADALVGELAPSKFLTTHDSWERWELVENNTIDLSTEKAAKVVDDLFDAKFLSNEDDYLKHHLIWVSEIITEIVGLPKVMSSAMEKTHRKIIDEYERTIEEIYSTKAVT